jgi:hypothetical protein
MRRLARLVWVRRVAILSVAVAGLGLFATGVRGLTQIDGHLATATDGPTTHQVRQGLDARDDCPWSDRDRQRL